MKRVITDEVVAAEHAAGRRVIVAPSASTVVTPSAWSRARELGVNIESAVSKGEVDRTLDPSGIVAVRGSSVRLGRFDGAGADRDVRLLDVVTGAQGSPMTAGFMSWSHHDSFPWSLDYDEIDFVVEGVLHVQVDGRTVEGRAGDVLYIPKGSRIVFATPNRVKVFYVTYPANWAGASVATGSAPARPLK